MSYHTHYDYADRDHKHYGTERTLAATERDIRTLRQGLRDARNRIETLERELREATARLASLERDTPQARQAQYEADLAAADLAASGYTLAEDYLRGGAS
jgi:septal ring factor EnvC (AmiA/AmiB activator)